MLVEKITCWLRRAKKFCQTAPSCRPVWGWYGSKYLGIKPILNATFSGKRFRSFLWCSGNEFCAGERKIESGSVDVEKSRLFLLKSSTNFMFFDHGSNFKKINFFLKKTDKTTEFSRSSKGSRIQQIKFKGRVELSSIHVSAIMGDRVPCISYVQLAAIVSS